MQRVTRSLSKRMLDALFISPMKRFTHWHEFDIQFRRQFVLYGRARHVTMFGIESHTRQSSHKLQTQKTKRPGIIFAVFKNDSADSLARMLRGHEEGSYFSRLNMRIKLGSATLGVAVAAEKRTSATPAAAADNLAL